MGEYVEPCGKRLAAIGVLPQDSEIVPRTVQDYILGQILRFCSRQSPHAAGGLHLQQSACKRVELSESLVRAAIQYIQERWPGLVQHLIAKLVLRIS